MEDSARSANSAVESEFLQWRRITHHASRFTLHADYLWLCPILLIGAFLRWHNLAAQSLWLDEAYTWGLARLDGREVWGAMLAVSDTSLLYYVLLQPGVRFFGLSEFGLRAFSVFAGWLALATAFRAGRALLGRSIALIATGLLAASPFAVWYSQDARPYALYLLLAAFTLWGFWRAANGRGWTMLMVSGTLLYLTHYAAALFAYAQLGFLLGDLRRRPLLLRRWALAQAIAAIPAAIWIALFLMRRQPITANTWIPPVTILAPLQTLANFLSADAARPNVLTVALGLLAVGLVGLGLRDFSPAKRLLAWWLFFPILLVLAFSFRLPAYVDRFFEPAILGLLLLIAAGVMSLPMGWRVPIVTAAVGLTLWSSVRLYFDPQYAKEDWRGAAEYLAASRLPVGLSDAEAGLGLLPYIPAGTNFASALTYGELSRLAEDGPYHLILRSPHESNHALSKSEPFDPLADGPAFFRDWHAAHPDIPMTVRRFVGLAVVDIGE